MSNIFSEIIRNELLSSPGVNRLAEARRFSAVYRESEAADRIFFLSSGLVKICHRAGGGAGMGKEVILRVACPDEIFGEEAFTPAAVRQANAEVLQESVVFSIPTAVFTAFAESHPGVWPLAAAALAATQSALEKKIEMLCLQDVESRAIYFLHGLALKLKHPGQESDFPIPLSQSELAGFIGATRETTSTMLNSLARRGLIKLGRRLLVVPSLEALNGNVAQERSVSAHAGAQS